mmetsp:Transcript_113851/g.367872  ORF Transcript_113851/g.367872 Transcript_113851/m.367872 type:complete len:243 (-) Transcript_113851:388-1116(-)
MSSDLASRACFKAAHSSSNAQAASSRSSTALNLSLWRDLASSSRTFDGLCIPGRTCWTSLAAKTASAMATVLSDLCLDCSVGFTGVLDGTHCWRSSGRLEHSATLSSNAQSHASTCRRAENTDAVCRLYIFFLWWKVTTNLIIRSFGPKSSRISSSSASAARSTCRSASRLPEPTALETARCSALKAATAASSSQPGASCAISSALSANRVRTPTCGISKRGLAVGCAGPALEAAVLLPCIA